MLSFHGLPSKQLNQLEGVIPISSQWHSGKLRAPSRRWSREHTTEVALTFDIAANETTGNKRRARRVTQDGVRPIAVQHQLWLIRHPTVSSAVGGQALGECGDAE